jgi:hypothetical protein
MDGKGGDRMKILLIPATLCVGLSAASCRSTNDTAYEKGLESADQATQHAVHSERLQEIMHQLSRNSLAFGKPDDTVVNRDERIREVARIGQAMSVAARKIPTFAQVDAEQRDAFTKLANELGRQADELTVLAGEGDVPKMEAALFSITRTCYACHSQFRLLPRAE